MDRVWKVLLVVAALGLAVNLFQGFRAEARDGQVGRYQVSAWAHQGVGYNGMIGYVVIDTTSGEIVRKWAGDLKDFRSGSGAAEEKEEPTTE